MIDPGTLLQVLPLFALALISPGPDFMIVSSISLSRGRLAGVQAAAGIATGTVFFAALALMGVAALFERALWLAVTVKILGGLYLLYLGIAIWRSTIKNRGGAARASTAAKTAHNAYLTGLFTNLTNPKAIAFFTSIFALALTPETSAQTKAVLIGTTGIMAFLWFAFVAAGLSRPAVRDRYRRWRTAIDRAAGSVMIVFGVKLVASTAD